MEMDPHHFAQQNPASLNADNFVAKYFRIQHGIRIANNRTIDGVDNRIVRANDRPGHIVINLDDFCGVMIQMIQIRAQPVTGDQQPSCP